MRGGFFATWAPRFLSILRIIAAFLIIPHGTQKLFSLPAAPPPPPQQQTQQQPQPQSNRQNTQQAAAQPQRPQLPPLMLAASIIEIAGGVLLLLGLFTRFAALILSGQMAVAYFMVHAPQGFWPIVNKGELAVIYCFVFLYLAVAGGGAWSVDSLRRRPSPSPYR